MTEPKDCVNKFRKEAVRLVLERMQGDYIEHRVDMLKEQEKNNPENMDNIKEQLFIPYVNHDGVALTMDIFEPVTDGIRELPVIILVHGGGLVFGDNLGARKYARKLCRKGCLVFSLEYRNAPRANVCQELDDVCSGMDFLGKKLVEFNVDFSRIYMVAESAGVYLALYVAAMKKSVLLQHAIGYKESNVPIRALGLFSGMFYTDREDPIKHILREQIYGNIPNESYFMYFTNPEHPEIMNNLPPMFFVTSRGDALNDYTISYHRAAKKAGIRSHLLYYGDKKLGHAFELSEPDNPKTDEVNDKMLDWFEKVHKETVEKKYTEPLKNSINYNFAKEIKNGKNTDMAVYQFVREMNRFNLSHTAIMTESRKYSYAQAFRSWERYAEAFSGMGITGKNGSRACILYPDSFEAVAAFFGLNMTGTPVSLMTVLEIFDEELWMNSLKKEGITDLLIIDYLATPRILRLLKDNRKKIGLRNIIVLKNSLGPEVLTPPEMGIFELNYNIIRNIPDIIFMEDMLLKYEAFPIEYAEDAADKEAATVHTSGTTKGVRKPIPFTNRQLILGAFRYERYYEKEWFDLSYTCGLTIDLSGAYGLINQLLETICSGGKIMINYLGLFDGEYYKVIRKYGVEYLTVSGMTLDSWMELPERPDLSAVKYVAIGGTFVSGDAKKRYNKFLEECGSRAKVIVGYGLSEVGGGITATDSEDDSVGCPVKGVKVKIQDEESGEFHDISEGAMTGGLYIHCDSMSSGTIQGEKYFDTVSIDGEEYLCTYDLARVDENKNITICGRMNNYFVNNEGVRFDAGLIENSLERQHGIKACVIAPSFDKIIHDTVPVLFAEMLSGEDKAATMSRALYDVFVKDGAFKETNLPSQVIFMAKMPHNQTGKVDRYKLDVNDPKAERFMVSPVKADDELIDINLVPVDRGTAGGGAVPDELQNANPLGAMDFTKLVSSPEMLKYMSPLVVSAILFGRIIPKDKRMNFGGCYEGKD